MYHSLLASYYSISLASRLDYLVLITRIIFGSKEKLTMMSSSRDVSGGGGRAGIGLFSFPIQIAVFCTTTILLLVVAVKEINAAI